VLLNKSFCGTLVNYEKLGMVEIIRGFDPGNKIQGNFIEISGISHLPVGPKLGHPAWRAPDLPIPVHPRAMPQLPIHAQPPRYLPKSLNQRYFSLMLAAHAQRRRRPSLMLTRNAGVALASLPSHSPSFQLPH
jgi:hypothetical protein